MLANPAININPFEAPGEIFPWKSTNGSLLKGSCFPGARGRSVTEWIADWERSFGAAVIDVARSLYQQVAATASAHTILSSVFLPVTAEMEMALAAPFVPTIRQALGRIEALTELPKARIAEDLFGVSKVAYHGWSERQPPGVDNEGRIRNTLDVLERASKRYPSPELLRGWLQTPFGGEAVKPMDLLHDNRLNDARILAVSDVRPNVQRIPDWLRERSIGALGAAARRRSITPSQYEAEHLSFDDLPDE
jgi:hypothetical protein